MTGKRVTGIPMTALFMIDPSDVNAVSQRVEELRRDTSETKGAKKSQDPFIICALSMDDLRASAEEVLALQRSVAALRLKFLTLPPDKKAAILIPQMEAIAQANSVTQLQGERRSALEEQKQAVKSLARAEEQVLAGGNGAPGDLITARADLERTLSELTSLQVKWVSELEQQATFYQETSQKLAQIAKFLLQPESSAALKTEYEKSVIIWRQLVDKTHKIISGRYALALPPLPDYPENLLSKCNKITLSNDGYGEIV